MIDPREENRITMTARYCRLTVWIALVWILPGLQAACSRSRGERETAPGRMPSGLAAGQLQQSDVDLYLDVMRAAAARVSDLPPGDLEILAKMKKIQQDQAAGRSFTPSEEEAMLDLIQQGVKLQSAMDEVIVEERGLDFAHYRDVRDLIEKTINPATAPEEEVDDGSRKPPPAAVILARQINKKLLAPHAPEIERLMDLVRSSLATR